MQDISKIILFSQSEFTDLGTVAPFLIDLSTQLKINIISYEYTYHHNGKYNKANEKECLKNCLLMVSFLCALESIEHIYLVGDSLGSYINYSIFPIINPKEKKKIENIIFIAPTWCYSRDTLKNNEKLMKKKEKNFVESISKNTKKILIIHGRKDDYVRQFLTYRIAKKLFRATELYPENGTHFNLFEGENREVTLKAIKKFLKESDINNNPAIAIPDNNYLDSEVFTNLKFEISENEDINAIKDFHEEADDDEDDDDDIQEDEQNSLRFTFG